ncbi:Glycosyl transferase family 11 [Variovorax sp. SRS16]|nr:Glycosyl transferase family 11 [Variovorax sp. SRS16]
MIISRLNGGLGNQLFQYACGRAFSLASGAELVLDLSALESTSRRVTRRHYELSAYAIHARPATRAEALKCRRAMRWGRPGAWMTRLDVLTESPALYPNLLRETRGDTLLAGFWQSETCFARYATEISQDLVPLRALSSQSQKLSEAVASRPSAAIHVRRGDYVNLPSAARFHGTLPMAYYQEAARRIEDRHGQPLWVVFSDDIAWCRGALNFLHGEIVFVDHNQGLDAWQDLQLMSLCRHHIIANSSFSWWGAWLSERRGRAEQMICAPSAWFVHDDPYAQYRIPKRWTRV